MEGWKLPGTSISSERIGGDFECFEASSGSQENGLYSCVAICRKEWRDDWPALGGTRHIQGGKIEDAKKEAVALAGAMYMKNCLLRRAEEAQSASSSNGKGRRSRFGWQGGKGVIWTPEEEKHVTPRRLLFHGQLLEHLGGEYIGSKDEGIGEPELQWIAKGSRFTIGLGCQRDTGEATAKGIHKGLETTLMELPFRRTTSAASGLQGLKVLVVGAGKVGLPLAHLLHLSGAIVFLLEYNLSRGDSLEAHYDGLRQRKAAIGEQHLDLLRELEREGRILGKLPRHDEVRAREIEAEVLGHGVQEHGIQVVSPNGGKTSWLARSPVEGGPTRTELLAQAADGGGLELILGAANEQVPIQDVDSERRENVLETLSKQGVWFVPDPIVSPGGVIAVSHELTGDWNAEAVNQDTEEIVGLGVKRFFELYRREDQQDEEISGLSPIRAGLLWRCFEDMVSNPWV